MKFTNVKKWLSMLLVVCSMLSLVACGKSDKDSAGDDSEKGTKVAVVFASSGLGDKSFNDALYDGMKKAESTMGIQWVYSEPKDDAEYEGLISGYADSGDCDPHHLPGRQPELQPGKCGPQLSAAEVCDPGRCGGG